MLWRRRLEPVARPWFRLHARLSRGLTLGVRGVVIDPEGRILLVEHTYVSGWHLPGGGVERGEVAADALARELEEEAGVKPVGPPRLVSIHSNHRRFRGDHVLVYVVETWTPTPATSRGEIHQIGWFAPNRLPAGVTGGTRARLAEIFSGHACDPDW
jgi:ADP-ribose pyrophosphatase YjhB (NUDIX family)